MNLRKLAVPIVIASATILGGCTVPMVKVGGYEGLTRVGEGKATVYVYREQSFVGAANTYDVLIDEINVGALEDGSFIQTDVEAGAKVVRTDTGMGSGSEVTFEKGHIYCMKLTLNFNILMKSADINPASLDTCKAEIAPLNYVMKRDEAKALGLIKKRQSIF
ncbi:hypothetical protein A9Q81_01370 [Gammaproteobacteria bacterium 42_54_T18]|nr:hypothetical protein A9Q81_01370 [Gammaproteobacteria bacterium 42_54_T18]